MNLRPFQQRMIDEARDKLREHRRVLMVAPTGSGKTVMMSRVAKGALLAGRRVWVTVHRDFLVDQTSATFDEFEIPHSFIATGMPFNPAAKVLICGIDTLKNRLDVIPPAYHPHIIMPDEAHHMAAGGWRRVADAYPKARFMGWTATPERLDGKGLDDLFDTMVLGPQISELMREGFLSKYTAYCPSTPDVSGLTKRAGDWALDELADLMDRGAIIGDMVRSYRELGGNRRAVYFCASIAHSQHVAAAFNAAGIPAIHLDGTTPKHERKAAARAFARGEIRVLTNVSLFGEGYDLKAQAGMDVSIDLVGLARPTQSLGLFLQMIGRAFRLSTGKDRAIILDHAGNLYRHGMPDQDRVWTLEGSKRKAASDGGGPGVKHCPKCLAATVSTARYCVDRPKCDHVWVADGKAVENVDGELREMSAEKLATIRRKEEQECETPDDLAFLYRKRGVKNPEAAAALDWMQRAKTAAREKASRAVKQFEFYNQGRWG